jgi:hypothetical protein
VEYAFRLALARKPTGSEADLLLSFLTKDLERYGELPAADRRLRAYADLCQSLFSANEFVYID